MKEDFTDPGEGSEECFGEFVFTILEEFCNACVGVYSMMCFLGVLFVSAVVCLAAYSLVDYLRKK